VLLRGPFTDKELKPSVMPLPIRSPLIESPRAMYLLECNGALCIIIVDGKELPTLELNVMPPAAATMDDQTLM